MYVTAVKRDVQMYEISELEETLVIISWVSEPHCVSQTPGKFEDWFFLWEITI